MPKKPQLRKKFRSTPLTKLLSSEYEHIILSGQWLNDDIIIVAQERRYPTVNGFQNVALGHTLSYNIRKENLCRYYIMGIIIG